jgi:hypothetical protein
MMTPWTLFVNTRNSVRSRWGKPLPSLVRKGAVCTTPTRLVDGFVVFNVPADGPKITGQRVKELLDSDLDNIILSSRR